DYYDRTAGECRVGFKPAGGIRTARQATEWLILMKEELGTDWMMPSLFRIGASSLLTDIERQLSHFLTGHYAAQNHFAMP
ncbi:MAG TPA: deoxyribose-phosphate aldolase, partial [Chloroflexota bacterium]|nr:deoxyribose-phosphate aldolase [Chloroflexota bacterium]